MNNLININGCIPAKVDLRNYKLKLSSESTYPEEYEIKNMPEIKNQGCVSSCVAHALSTILEYHDCRKHTLSTNFIYGLQRKLFNNTSPGMRLQEACSIANKYGDALEIDCPGNDEIPKCYDVTENCLVDNTKITKAYDYHIQSYFDCNTEEKLKYTLYKYGPVLASIRWYKCYKLDSNGVLYGEDSGEYGEHAIVVYGYNEKGFLCQNSWGKSWGKEGRFIFPYSKKFKEAKGIIDYVLGETDDIKIPIRGKIIDIFYKFMNYMLNIIKDYISK